MHYAQGDEKAICETYIAHAAAIAASAYCFRSKCGSVIVKDNTIIGQGFNSPPGNECIERCLKDDLPKEFKSDKTCCVHAEQRAIMDALAMHPQKMKGARIYFIRLDERGQPTPAGKPYCTICSKMALDAGIGEFVLWQAEGMAIYPTDEYNALSFAYRPDIK